MARFCDDDHPLALERPDLEHLPAHRRRRRNWQSIFDRSLSCQPMPPAIGLYRTPAGRLFIASSQGTVRPLWTFPHWHARRFLASTRAPRQAWEMLEPGLTREA